MTRVYPFKGPSRLARPGPSVILFAVYALVVWYLALRFRRRVGGFVIVALGGMAAAYLGRVLPKVLPSWLIDPEGYPGIQWLFWAEAGVVWGVGLFIACLPRPLTYPHCPYCRYDLRGLEGEVTTCPECGQGMKGHEGLTPRLTKPGRAVPRVRSEQTPE